MASYTFTGSNLCSGGEHFTLTVTGDANATRDYDLTQFLQVSNVPDEEWFKRLLRIHFNGQTKAQIKTALAGGVTITI